MSEIKDQVKGLPLNERRQLAAFLVSLRHKEMSDYRKRMADKIDDTDESNWVSLEEFDRRIAQ